MAVGNGAERGANNGGGAGDRRGGLLRRGSDDVAVEQIARARDSSSGLFGVIALNSKNRMQALECRMKSQTHTQTQGDVGKKVADEERHRGNFGGNPWKLDGEEKCRSGKR